MRKSTNSFRISCALTGIRTDNLPKISEKLRLFNLTARFINLQLLSLEAINVYFRTFELFFIADKTSHQSQIKSWAVGYRALDHNTCPTHTVALNCVCCFL
jgi:hypothetical protein